MKRITKRICGLLLAVTLAAGQLPAVEAAAAEEQTLTYEYEAVGNTGATIEITSGQEVTAEVDDTSLAQVSVNDSLVTVTGVQGANGIANVSLSYGGAVCTVAVPIGYTTFVFDGDNLRVYEGSSSNYEISSLNCAAQTETDAVTGAAQEDGSVLYTNTDEEKLRVNIKKKGGSYVFTGETSDMSIAVNKESKAATELLLAGLKLTSSFTAPITVKKNSEEAASVAITSLEGHSNVLSDAAKNNAALYGDATDDGGDGTNTEFAESAVIKGKAAAKITINGTGSLTLNCNSKNAVKVGESGYLVVDGTTLAVTSAGNGLSSDNTLTIRSGNLTINAAADAIRSNPDTVSADAGCAGNITVEGGTLHLMAGSDGIQAAQDLTVTGGKFVLNTADDAVHSDAYVTITGGNFEIRTGDDGVHADTSLTLGEENGSDEALSITVNNCYEGLEGGCVYIYSGTYRIQAEDDGINAAGDSGSSDNFNPGGGPGGRPGGPGQGAWGGSSSSTSGTQYNITITGGNIYVNVSGDGLDANTDLNLLGGTLEIWGAPAGNDNEPLDCDGTLTINGATVFAAGSNVMMTTPGSGSQSYVTYGGRSGGFGGFGGPGQGAGGNSSSINAGKTIYVKNNGSAVYQAEAVKAVSYVLYSSPEVTSSGWSIDTEAPATDTCADGHTYGSGVVTTAATCLTDGVMTYTCLKCKAVKTETIKALGHNFTNYVSDGNATTEADGTKTAKCTRCSATDTVTDTGSRLTSSGSDTSDTSDTGDNEQKTEAKKGDTFAAGNNLSYKILSTETGKKYVSCIGFTSKNKKTKVTIPATVTYQGVTYRVTQIAASAFQNETKLKKVTIGKNVTTIGKKAFYKCSALKQIVIRSKSLKKVGNGAITGISKKAVIRVPKKQRTAYKKLFRTKAGYKRTMTITG